MEVVNSSLNAYGKLIDSQAPHFHEYSKIKVFDYEAIFLTLQNATDPKIEPYFETPTFKLPVVKSIYMMRLRNWQNSLEDESNSTISR